jgi:hypothetical protein
MVDQNIQLSDVVFSDVLGSDHIPIVSHKFTNWEWFQSLILPKLQIQSVEEDDKSARLGTLAVGQQNYPFGSK